MGIHITSVTPKQIAILKLLYTFRFLNRHQIQSLLKHKDYRLINAWLAFLVKSEVVGRIYSKTFGENTKPAIYYLKTKSKQHLEKLEGISPDLLKRVYRERGRSKKFVDHCVQVADLYLYVISNFKGKVQFFSKTELTLLNYLPTPKPDAYIASEDESGNTKRYFIEVIDSGVPHFAIRKRIHDYFDYAENKTWESVTNHPFPSVLCVCPNDFTRNYLYRLIKGIESESAESIDFFLSTQVKIIWQKVE